MKDQHIKENIMRELTEMGEKPEAEDRKNIIHHIAKNIIYLTRSLLSTLLTGNPARVFK
jgi:hypothetical protein